MKRRLFQIDLLTAMVGMLSLGVFVGLNATVYSDPLVSWVESEEWDRTKLKGTRHYWTGWPATISEETPKAIGDFLVSFVVSKDEFESDGPRPKPVRWSQLRNVPNTFSIGTLCTTSLQNMERFALQVLDDIDWKIQEKTCLPAWDVEWNWKGVATNAAVAFATTLSLMIGLEWFLRRRERRKVRRKTGAQDAPTTI